MTSPVNTRATPAGSRAPRWCGASATPSGAGDHADTPGHGAGSVAGLTVPKGCGLIAGPARVGGVEAVGQAQEDLLESSTLTDQVVQDDLVLGGTGPNHSGVARR